MKRRRIVLRPTPNLPARFAEPISRRVAEIVGRPVHTGPAFTLDPDAYDASRRQYRGEEILWQVCMDRGADDEDVVALVDEDCYGAALNYVFGQAALRGGCAFVALARLRNSFWGKRNDEVLFRMRVVKEVVHELGHTWGLLHCPNPNCIMHFSNSIADTDCKGPSFCPVCQSKLHD